MLFEEQFYVTLCYYLAHDVSQSLARMMYTLYF